MKRRFRVRKKVVIELPAELPETPDHPERLDIKEVSRLLELPERIMEKGINEWTF